MPFILLAMWLIVTVTSSMLSLHVVQNQNTPLSSGSGAAAAQAWLAYKAALLKYLEDHPNATGPISLGLLGLNSNGYDLSSAGNQIVRNDQSVTIEAWMELTADQIAAAIHIANGDMSIGTSLGDRWTAPSVGDMGLLPVSAPVGDAVSVVSLSGTGYQ
ncbi:type IV pilus biogenesis protein PilM [Gluconacetobacter sp. Hr-1-5]|uniref:type IV pilus biogenesis protein PilM n=1 Tax=Gluconacetobacter sp. Hr-1-5 TaxID=3395370 RepID=UPI003B524173